jgi:hypothetical protein
MTVQGEDATSKAYLDAARLEESEAKRASLEADSPSSKAE